MTGRRLGARAFGAGSGLPTPVCVFAKTPRPGRVKTRLAVDVGEARAVALARAFLQDTWAGVRRLPWARPILALSGPARGLPALPDVIVHRQGGGDLGQRLARVFRRTLASAPAAIAIGADSPGLPGAVLARARTALARADAVLGPAADGGFYLLGLRRCPSGLLRDLPWSQPVTFSRALERLRAKGLSTIVLPPWFDVDRGSDLPRLARLLSRRPRRAPRTARLLAAFAREPP